MKTLHLRNRLPGEPDFVPSDMCEVGAPTIHDLGKIKNWNFEPSPGLTARFDKLCEEVRVKCLAKEKELGICPACGSHFQTTPVNKPFEEIWVGTVINLTYTFKCKCPEWPKVWESKNDPAI